jgi:hypothetical protein
LKCYNIRSVSGENTIDTLTSMNDLGNHYFNSGQVDKAFDLFKKCFDERKNRLGLKNVQTLRSMYPFSFLFSSNISLYLIKIFNNLICNF